MQVLINLNDGSTVTVTVTVGHSAASADNFCDAFRAAYQKEHQSEPDHQTAQKARERCLRPFHTYSAMMMGLIQGWIDYAPIDVVQDP